MKFNNILFSLIISCCGWQAIASARVVSVNSFFGGTSASPSQLDANPAVGERMLVLLQRAYCTATLALEAMPDGARAIADDDNGDHFPDCRMIQEFAVDQTCRFSVWAATLGLLLFAEYTDAATSGKESQKERLAMIAEAERSGWGSQLGVWSKLATTIKNLMKTLFFPAALGEQSREQLITAVRSDLVLLLLEYVHPEAFLQLAEFRRLSTTALQERGDTFAGVRGAAVVESFCMPQKDDQQDQAAAQFPDVGIVSSREGSTLGNF